MSEDEKTLSPLHVVQGLWVVLGQLPRRAGLGAGMPGTEARQTDLLAGACTELTVGVGTGALGL